MSLQRFFSGIKSVLRLAACSEEGFFIYNNFEIIFLTIQLFNYQGPAINVKRLFVMLFKIVDQSLQNKITQIFFTKWHKRQYMAPVYDNIKKIVPAKNLFPLVENDYNANFCIKI
jgi:hypothetical protein